MNNVIVSVIVPVYNSKKYIDQCLYHLLNQSLDEIEIICIDDGSTDDSLSTLRWYEKKYDKVRVYSQENKGASYTRNRGLDLAKGEYILFVDIDDWIDLNTIELLYKNIVNNNSDIVLYNSLEFNDKGKLRDRIFFYINNNLDVSNYTFNHKDRKNLVFNSFLVCWSKFYKKSFLKEKNIRFNEHHTVLEDIQFHIYSMILADRISYSPGKMYHYRKDNYNSVQNSRVNSRAGFVIFKIIDEIKDFLEKQELYDFYESNFLKFCINEFKVRLNSCDEDIKEETYQKIRKYFLNINLTSDNVKEIDFILLKFYFHIISTKTYLEFLYLENKIQYETSETNYILLNEIYEKNKIISKNNTNIFYDDLIKQLSDSFDNNHIISPDTINKINEMNLFDEEYYLSQIDYELNMNPLLHYIYIGYKEGLNPSKTFNTNYYLNYNKNISPGENPLVYFVEKGLKEGLVKITPTSWQPPEYVNLFEIDKKIEKFDGYGITLKKRKKELIVSLTSYPERMKDIHYCIFSLLNQTVKPDKLILWLAKEQFPNGEYDIPNQILKFKKNGLTIKFCDDLRSYKKLIPVLEEYPESVIVTSDDDLYYQNDWLEKLYKEHLKYSECIIGHRGREIKFKNNMELDKYMKWDLVENDCKPSYKILMTGAGGILYPPYSLHKEIFNKSRFMSKYLYTDDIWFWAMSVLNDTKIKTFDDNYIFFAFVNPARDLNMTNESTLFKINKDEGNFDNMKNIFEDYPELLEKIKNE